MARLILRLAADVIGTVVFFFAAAVCGMNAVAPLAYSTAADRGISLGMAAMFLLATFALGMDLYRSLGRGTSGSRAPDLGVVPSRRAPVYQGHTEGVRRG